MTQRCDFVIFRAFDPLIRFLFQIKAQDEKVFAENRAGKPFKNSAEYISDHVLFEMGNIDSKSSALLTHVSIMLAIVIVVYSRFSDIHNKANAAEEATKVLLWVTSFELILFSLVAIALLRCVDIMGPPWREIEVDDTTRETQYSIEIQVRRAVYQVCLRVVNLLTALLVGTVVYDFVFTHKLL